VYSYLPEEESLIGTWGNKEVKLRWTLFRISKKKPLRHKEIDLEFGKLDSSIEKMRLERLLVRSLK
jgi:hypothetical protein